MSLIKYPFDKNIKTLSAENIFTLLCYDGNKECASWLYDISKKNKNLSINVNSAFKIACLKGNKEIVEWLYNLSKDDITLDENGNVIFVFFCENGFII